VAGGAGALDHGAGVVERAAGAIHDHIETTTIELLQPFGRGAVAHQVLHTLRRRLVAAREQGEGMAGRLQALHQGFAHEARAAHHQDVHADARSRAEKPAPFWWAPAQASRSNAAALNRR
jgi:hypothetical protein